MVDPHANSDPDPPGTRARSRLGRLARRPELGAAAGALLVFAFFGAVAGDSGMYGSRGVVNFLEVSALLGILAVPVALLMIGGEFDLSVGSMIGAAGVVIAIPAAQWGWPLWACIALAFAFAAAVGAANGWLTVRTGLPSFIVTLASLFVLRGLTIGGTRWATGRTQVGGLRDLVAADPVAGLLSGDVATGAFAWLASAGFLAARTDGGPAVPGLPVSIVWWLALGLIGAVLLQRTRAGNWIFAVGGSAPAARNLGVPVARVKILLFVGTALGAALVAAIQVLDAGSADTNRGLQKEFEAITAAVIGGCVLTGGTGSVLGAMFGALIFGTVQMGIFYTGVDTDWFKVFVGAMLLGAVLVNRVVGERGVSPA